MKIAFISDRSGSSEIWVSGRDGGNPLQLTRMRQAEAGTPRWSPDGQRLVFDARPEQSGDLFAINAGGGAPQRLTTEPSHDVMPSWSRDGQWIYFCSNRGGDYQIWKMPASGGQAARATLAVSAGTGCGRSGIGDLLPRPWIRSIDRIVGLDMLLLK